VARDVARILAGLVGAADDRVLEIVGRERRARDELPDDAGEKVVGAPGKAAGMAPDRRAQPV